MDLMQCVLETKDKVGEAADTLRAYNKHAKDANLEFVQDLISDAWAELNKMKIGIKRQREEAHEKSEET